MRSPKPLAHGLACAALAAAGCAGGSLAGDGTGIELLVGSWRGVLSSHGGDLPFRVRVDGAGGTSPGALINGDQEMPIAAIERQGAGTYRLLFSDPGAELVAKLSPGGDALSGFWRRSWETRGESRETVFASMPFAASRGDARRFPRNDPSLALAPPEAVAALPRVAGTWRVEITRRADPEGVWELRQDAETVTATSVLDGEPAVLEGIYRNGLLRLSSFDGRRAFLIHARATPAGTLQGTLWVDDQRRREWSARRPR